MATQRKLEKSARKAYSVARNAVDEAERTAKKLTKKTRAKAAALADRLANVEKVLAKSAARSKQTRDRAAAAAASAARPAPGAAKAGSVLTPPLPDAPAPQVNEASLEADVRFTDMNLQALRALAKQRGLTNYSRLNKADLIGRLRDE